MNIIKKLLIGLIFIPLFSIGQSINLNSQKERILTFSNRDLTSEIYNESAIALFARMTTQPRAIEKPIYSRLFDRLQANYIQDSLDWMYLTGVHSEQAANLNIFNSNFYLTNNGATWVPYYGFTGNGTSSYLNTNYNPASDGIHYKQTSAIFGIGIDSLSSNTAYHGVSDGTKHLFIIPNLSGSTYCRINTITNRSQVNGLIHKIFVTNKTNSTTVELWIGNSVYEGTNTLGGVPNLDMYLLGNNNSGSPANYSSNNLNCAFTGGGLTKPQVDSLINIINDFNASMRDVEP